MIKIGFTGVPGSGKTSLARGVASACRSIPELKNLELCSEYARRYISKYGAIESPLEQYRIMNKQVEWEDSIGQVDLLLTDSPIFLGMTYAFNLSNHEPKDVMAITDLFKAMIKLNNPSPRYDLIFHLPPKKDIVEDGIRPKFNIDENWKEEMDTSIKATMFMFKPCHMYIVKATDTSARIEDCISVIQSLFVLSAAKAENVSVKHGND
jgi:deoxyadenosine/deoxycytidine kinase